MARQKAPAGALEEFEGSADRFAEWIRRHALWLGAAILLSLALGIAYDVLRSSQQGTLEEASAALAETRAEYLTAMGADPGAFEVPELANPQAAEQIRAEYAERFEALAREYAGTVPGTMARLESIELLELPPAEAAAALEEVLAAGPGSRTLEAVVQVRLAQAQEAAGSWEAAAESHLAAAEIDSYPLRHFAVADAARCFARAGDAQRALGLYQSLEQEAPEFTLPEHHRALARELQASVGS